MLWQQSQSREVLAAARSLGIELHVLNAYSGIAISRQPVVPPRAASEQVQSVPQSQDRKGARPEGAGHSACPRRRGPRVMKRRDLITLLGGAAFRRESAVSALLLAACRLLTRGVCRQSISDSWLGNLRECLAHLV